ncbi:MAG: insulinase family protein [Clostridia bacterium]|nr:insulinase family protein [Clostridia bacterium]
MEEKLLSTNGVEIYGYRSPYLHSFCLCLYVKAGPLYEEDCENGISHFFEHTAFRSINTALGGELYRRADMLGINMNAVTYKEFIQFKITGATEKFKESVDILCEIFTPFNVPKSELDIERKRIKSELRESDEKNSLEYFSEKIVWSGTRMSNTILGKNAVLDRIGITALSRAQRKLLSAGNIFFYVTGNYGDDGLCYLSDAVSGKSVSSDVARRDNIAPIPKDFGNRNALVSVKNSKEHIVRFSFDIFSERYSCAECYLLYDILFSGECSKIFKGLSDESGMVYSYDASIERYRNIGSLSFLYEVGAKDVVKSVKKVVEILSSLKKGIRDELDYARASYVVNAKCLLDEPEELNFQLGYEGRLMGHGYASFDERTESYKSVTPERMTEIVREIFRPENLVLTFKEDKKRISIDEIRSVVSEL